MKQEIKYRGFTAQPSDYECPDGDLASAFNLVHEDGSLRPMAQPSQLFHLNTGEEIIFVHTTAVFKHYIVLNTPGNTLSWIDANDTTTPPTRHIIYDQQATPSPVVLPQPQRINAVGNTLCVLCGTTSTGYTDGIHYFLWLADNNNYKYLGTQPEFLELSFGLSVNKAAHYDVPASVSYPDAESTYYSAYADTGEEPSHYIIMNASHTTISFKKALVGELNDIILALVNKTNNTISKEGHFYAPFFVRYCYRLYDGTMWMHSAPVFMPVSMPFSFHVEIPNIFEEDGVMSNTTHPHLIDEDFGQIELNNLMFRYKPQNVALTCKLIGGSVTKLLNEWGDIIKSLDIFISQPILREDSSEKIETATIADDSFGLKDGGLSEYNYTVQSDSFYYSDAEDEIHDIICNVPLLSNEAYLDKIHSVANFYKVKSFSLEEAVTALTSSFTELDIDKSVLPVLATQEVMTDDYKTHNTLLPLFDDNGNCVTSLYNYNNRQNVAAMRERLFQGFKAMTPYCSHYNGQPLTTFNILQADVFIRTEEGVRVNSILFSDYTIVKPILYNCPLFYPDNRAVKMEFYIQEPALDPLETEIHKYVVPMEAHPMLNGSITKGGIMANLTDFYTATVGSFTPIARVASPVSLASKLYTSEVNNPFFFPATGINTIGTGTILGITSATKALSQGQFGQFPLYAFTTDGIWALSVASDGTFSDMHPVTRDVCIDHNSITQLDSSVLFATDRGIMHLSGSTTECISDFLNDDNNFDPMTSLPQLADLPQLASFNVSIKPFSDFIHGSRMLYDYTHQRIFLFNPSQDALTGDYLYPYSYVYSLKSRLWSLMLSNLSYILNSYPDALAVDADNYLVSFSQSEQISSTDAQLLVTRPIKLGDGNVLKAIHTLLQRGFFQRGEVKTVLYGSRDLINWHLVASSTSHELRSIRGTSYKYFRIVAVTTLADGHSLSGATVEFEPRHTNVIH